MKRQTATQIVGLSLLGLFLLSALGGCGGGTITSLGKDEFHKKVVNMRPDEVVKWLGKPSRVTDDDGTQANWHYHNACYDKITGKKCDAHLEMLLVVLYGGQLTPGVRACNFSSEGE